jgi:hypothetical protein
MVIVESGVWYCLVWVAYGAVRLGTLSNAEYILESMLAQFTVSPPPSRFSIAGSNGQLFREYTRLSSWCSFT